MTERPGIIRPETIGILPNLPAVDSAPLLQAACDAIQGDALIDFCPGIYYLGGPVTWSKRVRILGAGERLTHFRCWPQFSAGDVFVSGIDGITFENIQFSSATSPRTSGAYIKMSHHYCRALNVWATNGFGLVDVQANACWVDRLGKFVWSTDPAAYSVRIGAGFQLMKNIGYAGA
jgi:hypothetical protein